MVSEAEFQERVERLAESLQEKGLAWSRSQALERAREIVMQELKAQESFERMKDDPSRNPQQQKSHIPPDVMAKSGGMLTGTELPDDVPLAELLKGRREKKE